MAQAQQSSHLNDPYLNLTNLNQTNFPQTLPHHYLLEWNKHEGKTLSQMIYRLKGDNSKPAWVFYARLFHRALSKKINFKNYQALVPIPSAKQSSVHAKIFANELSSLLGLPVWDLLKKNPAAPEQKKRSAVQREQIAAEITNISRKSTPATAIAEIFTKHIFVDDVLTTGQSFLQSKAALGGSAEDIVITLFYRPKA